MAYSFQLIPISKEFFLTDVSQVISNPIDTSSSGAIKDKLLEDVVNDSNTSKLLVNSDVLHAKLIAKTPYAENNLADSGSPTQTTNTTATTTNTTINNVVSPNLSYSNVTKDDLPFVFKDLGVDLDYVVKKIQDGFVPIIVENFGKFKKRIKFVKRPKVELKPSISIIQEFKTVSYLGNYGAGKTVKTMSLLPGEKTTITIKTFAESVETKKHSENIMDSFSENSASEFENTLKEQNDISNSSSNENTDSNHSATSVSASLSISAVIPNIMAKINANVALTSDTSHDSVSDARTTMESTSSNLHEAVEKHSNQTNANREVQINSENTSTDTNRTENSIVREIFNPNLNRVLNFVFRQLQQEYITITYLNNIKVFYTDGNPEHNVLVPINELDEILSKTVKKEYRSKIKQLIINEYEVVENYKGENLDFLESVSYDKPYLGATDTSDLDFLSKAITIWRKNPNLVDTYDLEDDTDLHIEVNGVILKVSKNVLRTPAVVVDALMGKGDALDCYNQIQQESKTLKLDIENRKLEAEINKLEFEKQKMQQVLTMISGLPDEQKTDAIKAVFGQYGNDSDVVITNN